jgi:uncharacterized membrane protein
METLYQALRILHIGAGMTAFFVAPVAMLVRKGGKVHAFWGNVFFWGMVAVAASAVPLTILHPNAFLFLVAVFSFHLSWSGYRAVRRRRAANPARAARVDLGVAVGMVLFYLALAGWGVHLFTLRPHHPFGYVSLAFAGIGLRFSGVPNLPVLYPPGRPDGVVVRPHAGHGRLLHCGRFRVLGR